MAHQHNSWIYGVVEREFRKEGRTTIVKLGRVGTRPVHKRLAEYPNGSVCLFAYSVQAGMDVVVEAAVLAAARKMFKERRDIGAEYIEAPLADLMAVVVKIVTPFLAVVGTPMDEQSETDGVSGTTETSDETSDDEDGGESKDADDGGSKVGEEFGGVDADDQQMKQTEQTTQDLPMLVHKYIEENRENLSSATVPVTRLYENVCEYTKTAGAKQVMTSRMLTSILVNDWNVRSMMADNGNGPTPVYVFQNLTPQKVENIDPRIPVVLDYIDKHIDFSPRRQAEDKGRKCYAWLTEKQIVNAFWELNKARLRANNENKNDYKLLVRECMELRGRRHGRLQPTSKATGKVINLQAYDRVAFITD